MDDLDGVSGIYAITNTVTGERYIGSSVDIGKRFRAHMSPMLYVNAKLRAALLAHGKDVFTCQVLEVVPPEDIDRLESAEMEYIRSEKPAYNVATWTSRNGHRMRLRRREALVEQPEPNEDTEPEEQHQHTYQVFSAQVANGTRLVRVCTTCDTSHHLDTWEIVPAWIAHMNRRW